LLFILLSLAKIPSMPSRRSIPPLSFVTQSQETKRSWQHLANAGQISGQFSRTIIETYRVAGVDTHSGRDENAL
jgi:hypothetical protein